MGSGESDAFYLSQRIKNEYEQMMEKKRLEKQAPQVPKNPDRLIVKRRGRPVKDDNR